MSNRALNRSLNKQVIKYLFVGGGAYLFEMLVLFFLKSLGLRDTESVSISFWLGFIFAFIAQKVITFNNADRSARGLSRQLIVYGALVLFNYGFTILVVNSLSDIANVYVLRTFVIGLTTVWNFVVYKFIFSKAKSKEEYNGAEV